LREALARTDNDFVMSEPRRKSPKRSGVSGFLRRPKLIAGFAAKHANFVMAAIFAGLLAAVLLNALIWQKSPHPAPIFARQVAIENNAALKSPEAQSDVAPSAPVARPLAPTAAPSVTAEQTPTTPHGRDPMAEAAELQAQKPVAARDPIAQLLKPAPPSESSKSVLAAQHALVKLGYVVKTDGTAGPAFRQALEKFERDRGLPVHGNLTPKIMRELRAQSGIAVE
jgi:hypothetical protein